MKYIVLVAVVAIVGLQLSGSIPLSSVGGSMTIGFAFLVAGLAVGVHEAWTQKRGVIGWIVNIIVSFVGVFVTAPLGGMAVMMVASPFMTQSSLAATGGPVAAIGLAGMMLFAILSAWGALWIVNRWR